MDTTGNSLQSSELESAQLETPTSNVAKSSTTQFAAEYCHFLVLPISGSNTNRFGIPMPSILLPVLGTPTPDVESIPIVPPSDIDNPPSNGCEEIPQDAATTTEECVMCEIRKEMGRIADCKPYKLCLKCKKIQEKCCADKNDLAKLFQKERAPPKKRAAKKLPAKKRAAKKLPVKKRAAKNLPVKKCAAKKLPAKKRAAEKRSPKKRGMKNSGPKRDQGKKKMASSGQMDQRSLNSLFQGKSDPDSGDTGIIEPKDGFILPTVAVRMQCAYEKFIAEFEAKHPEIPAEEMQTKADKAWCRLRKAERVSYEDEPSNTLGRK